MKVAIKDLKDLCEKILTIAEQSGLKDIEVNHDFYRIFDDIYNLDIEKPELIIGSFIDDWKSLQNILNDKNPPTTLDFERLGNVIKIIGDSISKSGNVII